MKQLERVRVRKGLIEILENTQARGMHTDFCKELEENIIRFLENLKEEGVLSPKTDTTCYVTPSPEMAEYMKRGNEREFLHKLYNENELAENDTPPGDYMCPECDHEATYEEFELTGEAISCPRCGALMQYDAGIEFNAYWDVEDIQSFTVKFEDENLDEVMQNIRDITDEKIEKLNLEVKNALRDGQKEMIVRNMLTEHYKSNQLSIPQLWEQCLSAFTGPGHPDSWFRAKCWLMTLARAYGVIDDFSFQVKTDPLGFIDTNEIEINITEAEDPVFDGRDYDNSIPTADIAIGVGLSIADIVLRRMEDNAMLDRNQRLRYSTVIERVKDEFNDLPDLVAKARSDKADPVEELKPTIDRIKAVIEDDLQHQE